MEILSLHSLGGEFKSVCLTPRYMLRPDVGLGSSPTFLPASLPELVNGIAQHKTRKSLTLALYITTDSQGFYRFFLH